MFTKRTTLLLCLGAGACVALALQWDNDYLSRLSDCKKISVAIKSFPA